MLTQHEYDTFIVMISVPRPDCLRRGQFFMNQLAIVNIDVYQAITGTDVDPFYDDDKIESFFKAITPEDTNVEG